MPDTPAPARRPGFARRARSLMNLISWRRAFTAMSYRNYRLYFWGQIVSLFGTWMQITAQGFLIYELTHSAAYLGLVGFANGIPTWLFMLYAGVVADRFQRRRVMIITQTVMAGLAFVLAFLTFLHWVRAWHIILLTFALGTANAFDAPARQAIVTDLVEDREDLPNAIALNSTMFNGASIIGPAVAGLIYALLGPGWCFTINGISFFAVIASLAAMTAMPAVSARLAASAWKDIREGIRYTFSHRVILTIMGLMAVTSLFGQAFVNLIPAWTVKVLKGNAATNGLLFSARGVGAMASALFIASLGRFQFKGKLLTFGSYLFPLALLAFSLTRSLRPSLIMLVAAGAAAILVFNMANALVQTLVEDQLRGRVMSIYSLTFFGFLPVGSLWIGMAAEKLGVPAALVINASLLLISAITVSIFMPKLRLQK
jgi:MFS family permease